MTDTTEVITFDKSRKDFRAVLNRRVADYFKKNQQNRFANADMVIKTMVMLALYFVPYFLIVTGVISGVFLTLVMVVIMGFGIAGIGLSVMHDGNHGSYSKEHWINSLMGYSLNVVGASSFNWKIQHNLLHHTYTNIYGKDEDISRRGIMRFSPHAPWKKFHKYQFIYAWFLYGLMTISWVFIKDFSQLPDYQKKGFLRRLKTSGSKEWTILILTKLIYFGYIFMVPVLVTPWLWWQVFLGILIMHFVTGFLLAIIFQPAHVTPSSDFPLPDKNHALKDNWTIHQLRTTTNYANNSRWFTWMVGGLNFQVEHHLFPGMCHVHFPQIAGIVETTAKEFGLPYNSIPTFAQALQEHLFLLRKLGLKPTS